MKVIFLSRSLGRGGAERQLVTLVKGLRGRDIDARIALFYRAGGLDDEAQNAGVPLIYLGKSGRWDLVGFLLRLGAMVRRERPQILHGYLPVPNILAALAKPLISHLRVVWGVRASNLDPSFYDRLSRLSYGLERRLSGIPDLIISNSHAGRDHAIARGFPAERTVVVPNGIDVARFKPDPEAGAKIRRNWGIGQKEKVVGLVGRHDPMKDHGTFLEAAAILAEQRQDIRFACVGGGPLGRGAAAALARVQPVGDSGAPSNNSHRGHR